MRKKIKGVMKPTVEKTQAGVERTTNGRPELSVVVCAHNEGEYIGRCLSALEKALNNFESNETVVIADRCSDNTAEIARGFQVRVVEKTWQRWKNSYSESLQTGYEESKGTKQFAIVDADVIIHPDFFSTLIPMLTNSVGSVSSDLLVYPSESPWNRIIYYWQRTYSIAPLGLKPWGACRLVRRLALDQVKGFRDSPTPDSDLDLRLAAGGYQSIFARGVVSYHIREIDTPKIIAGQIASGRGRYQLGESLFHTIGHAVLRVRPFVVTGWLMEHSQDEERH